MPAPKSEVKYCVRFGQNSSFVLCDPTLSPFGPLTIEKHWWSTSIQKNWFPVFLILVIFMWLYCISIHNTAWNILLNVKVRRKVLSKFWFYCKNYHERPPDTRFFRCSETLECMTTKEVCPALFHRLLLPYYYATYTFSCIALQSLLKQFEMPPYWDQVPECLAIEFFVVQSR